MGIGTRTAATHPRSVEAHWIPIPWNIWREKSGKLAATIERQNVFAAIADAALYNMLEKSTSCGNGKCDIQHEICVDQIVEQLDEDD